MGFSEGRTLRAGERVWSENLRIKPKGLQDTVYFGILGAVVSDGASGGDGWVVSAPCPTPWPLIPAPRGHPGCRWALRLPPLSYLSTPCLTKPMQPQDVRRCRNKDVSFGVGGGGIAKLPAHEHWLPSASVEVPGCRRAGSER